jgi:cytochrome c
MRFVTALALVVLAASSTSAQQRRQEPKPQLKTIAADQQVASMRYCDGTYLVETKDGSRFPFPEFNLRFKTDGGPDGPAPGQPALLSANMMGDRAFVIFASPDEISGFIKVQC